MSLKRKGGVKGKKWEGVGDAIVKLVASENIEYLPYTIKGHQCINYLTSNECLSLIRDSKDFPIRFKSRTLITSEERKADEVEYYIAFLYFNFGIESAKRFVLNRIVSAYIKK